LPFIFNQTKWKFDGMGIFCHSGLGFAGLFFRQGLEKIVKLNPKNHRI